MTLLRATDGCYWQVVGDAPIAGDFSADWEVVTILQLMEPPYCMVAFKKDDRRLTSMVEVRDIDVVMLAADWRAKKRKEMEGLAEEDDCS